MKRRILAYILIMLSLTSCMNALDAPDGNDLLAPALTLSEPAREGQPMDVVFRAKLNGGIKSNYQCGFYISPNKDYANAEKVKASNVDTKTGTFSYVKTFPSYDATWNVKAYCSNGRIELTSSSVSYTHKRIAVTGVSLIPTSLTLTVGSTSTLTATVSPSNAGDKSVTWSSNNTGVATVDQSGKVTAIKAGSATITVKTNDGGYTATCYVTVNSIHVSSVSLNKTSTSLTVGSSETLTPTVTPSNAADKSVTWSSNNTGVATVDQNGKVTAIKAGSATITVRTNDGGYTATCNVTVNPIHVSSVSLNKTSTSLTQGGTETLIATVNPSNAADKSVTWSSNNTGVATVDQSGKVTAVKAGSATITVKTNDGGYTATCTVTVNPIRVTGISLNKAGTSLTVGSSETLTATVSPSNAGDKSVTWSSNNTGVATVDQNGKVTAVKAGNATITVKTNDGNYTATCTVTVNPIRVTGISLNKAGTSLTVGSSETLTATVSPSNASNKSVTWSSNNTGVATVDQNGKITAVKAGTATITVKTTDGNYTATCSVTVNPITIHVSGILLNKAGTSLTVGSSETLTATISPSNASNKSVTWSSDNTGVATVDQNGKVTAVKAGNATITVKTTDGNYTATCYVTVNPIHVSSVGLSSTSLTLTVDNTSTLTATVSPSNAGDKSVTWSSNNTGVATVDQNGKITAIKAGTATITVKTTDGGYTATCYVTVNSIHVSGVSLNKTSTSLIVGSSETLTATVSPSNAADKSVTWSSNNTGVATVDQNGKVTAVKAGSATITVKTTDGGYTATCTVTVIPSLEDPVEGGEWGWN